MHPGYTNDFSAFLSGARLIGALAVWGLYVGGTPAVFGENPAASVNVEAHVLIPLDLETVDGTINFGIVNPGQSEAKVNPINHGERAAAFRITGSEGFAVEIAYPAQVILEAQDNGSAPNLSMTPLLSGNTTDNQSNSGELAGPPSSAELNGSGEYYFWAGGEIDNMGDLQQGTYEGQFTITIDYDL